VVIPRAAETEILTRAWDKVAGEDVTREALRRGTPLGEVYRTYGIL
jgi:4-hydroxy-4-methyl-2-oxoglutarate aldolase